MKAKTRNVILANMTQLTSVLMLINASGTKEKWLGVLLLIFGICDYLLSANFWLKAINNKN